MGFDHSGIQTVGKGSWPCLTGISCHHYPVAQFAGGLCQALGCSFPIKRDKVKRVGLDADRTVPRSLSPRKVMSTLNHKGLAAVLAL